MKPHNPITFLIEKTKESVDDAAQKLAYSINQQQQSQQKLKTLQTYCNDYQQRFDQQQIAGIHLDQIKNFQQFLAKLQQALYQQEQEIIFWEEKVIDAKKDWQNAQSKLKSYQILQTREHQKQQAKENKYQQKQNDEFATLSFTRTQNKT